MVNSLADSEIADILDRLHQEAEVRMPVLRDKVSRLRAGGEMPQDRPCRMNGKPNRARN